MAGGFGVLATAVFLALQLQRPLLLEGEPGVGKTELAKALTRVLQRQLLRLQCYDGMELREALYEWNHTAQLLHMRAAQDTATPEQIERERKFDAPTVTKVGKSADELWEINKKRVQRRSTKVIVSLIVSGVAIVALVIIGVVVLVGQS